MPDEPVAAAEVAIPATAATPTTLTTLRALARRLGVNASQISRAIQRGRLSGSVRWIGNRPWIVDVALAEREWAAATDLTTAPAAVLDRTRASADDSSGNVAANVAREKHWRALTLELEYQKKVGALVDKQATEKFWTDQVVKCRTELLALPRRLKAAIPALTLEQINLIDRQVREALQALANGDVS